MARSVAALASGSFIGAAIVAITGISNAFKEAKKEAAEFAKEAKQQAKETADAWRELATVLNEINYAGMGDSREKDLAKNKSDMEKRRAEVIGKRDEAQDKVKDARKELTDYTGSSHVLTSQETDRANREARLNNLANARSQLAARQKELDDLYKLEDVNATRINDMWDQRDQERAAEARKKAADEKRWWMDFYNEVEKVQLEINKEEDKKVKERIEGGLKTDTENANVEGESRMKVEEINQKKAATDKAQGDKNWWEEFNAQVEKAQKSIDALGKVSETVGQSFGDMFGAMISGSKSGAQAFKDMGKQMLSSLVGFAGKEIMTNALVAGSGVAKALAGLGPAGPFLAIGGMAAMIAAVQGLLGRLPSAEGGWDLPNFSGGVLAVLHGGEQVLPKNIADRYRNGGPGAAGGQPINLNVTTMDAASFRTYLKGPAGDEVLRMLREAATDRRL
jgi:hypothetical protein